MPVSGMGLAVLLEALLRPCVASVSLDVMEFCSLESLRESARSIWTNLGVTAALLLTVAVGLLQADSMSQIYATDAEMQDTLTNIQLSYNLFSELSLLYCIWAILACVVYLCYVDPLTNQDAIKFFIANPAVIGGPVLNVIFGSVHLLVALLLYVVGTSGLPNAICFAIFMVIILVHIGCEIRDKSLFDPSGASPKSIEWQWTQRDRSEWPWFVRQARNEKAVRVFQKMGRFIDEAEGAGAAAADGTPAAGKEEKALPARSAADGHPAAVQEEKAEEDAKVAEKDARDDV